MVQRRSPTGPRVPLDVEERSDDHGATLVLSGELDIASAAALQRTIARLCPAAAPATLTVDLSRLVFIDSTGLAAVVYANRLCTQRGWELIVIRGPESVQHVFDLTGLTDLLPFARQGEDRGDAGA